LLSLPASIGVMLQDLQRLGLVPPSTDNFLDALRVMNAASHRMEVDADGRSPLCVTGTTFLAEFTALRVE
jgi:hypothetical protein